MNIRPFDWRDLPVLHRYRNQCLFLDSTLALTRGPVLAPTGALLSSLMPAAASVFTFISNGDDAPGDPLVGQVTYNGSSPSARLTLLAPEETLEPDGVIALLDYAAARIGEQGAFHVLAEVDEKHPVFESLHRAGFAIYARQRIWKLSGEPAVEASDSIWRSYTDRDLIPVRSLYSNLAPGLVQQVEPPPASRMRGMVNDQDTDTFGYVEIRQGPQGIWMQPFIHPDTANVSARLAGLLKNLPGRRSRPVYLCVRSYQSWLELAIEDMGGQPGPRQAVMVKRLAIARRAAQQYPIPALNGKQAEPTVPFTPVGKTDTSP